MKKVIKFLLVFAVLNSFSIVPNEQVVVKKQDKFKSFISLPDVVKVDLGNGVSKYKRKNTDYPCWYYFTSCAGHCDDVAMEEDIVPPCPDTNITTWWTHHDNPYTYLAFHQYHEDSECPRDQNGVPVFIDNIPPH